MSDFLKWSGYVLGALALLLVLAWFWRWHLAYGVVVPMVMAPSGDVDDYAFAPLDYDDDDNWASLPTRANDYSDRMPDGARPVDPGDVDVFYIHPTSYLSGASWNVLPSGMKQTPLLEGTILPDQPAAFNECCRVYAPYYQQATFYSFIDRGPNGLAALDRAYEDVRASFQYYLENWSEGRDFVIAAHSQGSLHAHRLIADMIVGTPLEDRLVVAYLPGYAAPQSPAVPVCTSDEQRGCFLSWNTVVEGYWLPPFFRELPLPDADGYGRDVAREFVCAPPSTDDDGAYTGYLLGEGTLATSLSEFGCEDGLLVTAQPDEGAFAAFPMSRGWLHVYEYAHLWVAIGEDAARRIAAE